MFQQNTKSAKIFNFICPTEMRSELKLTTMLKILRNFAQVISTFTELSDLNDRYRV